MFSCGMVAVCTAGRPSASSSSLQCPGFAVGLRACPYAVGWPVRDYAQFGSRGLGMAALFVTNLTTGVHGDELDITVSTRCGVQA